LSYSERARSGLYARHWVHSFIN